jgi:hypothetical protein
LTSEVAESAFGPGESTSPAGELTLSCDRVGGAGEGSGAVRRRRGWVSRPSDAVESALLAGESPLCVGGSAFWGGESISWVSESPFAPGESTLQVVELAFGVGGSPGGRVGVRRA